VLIGAVALVAYIGLNSPGRPPLVVKGDGEGYYAYLTAYLIDRDPSFATLVDRRFPTDRLVGLSGLSYQPATGRYLDKYAPGVAVMTLPFFAVGHGVAALSGERADGYSRSEQLASGLAALAWGIAGLAALRRLLLRLFPDPATAATLLCLGLGTSLLSYLALDSSYSHAFSFAAVALTLLAVIRWREGPQSWRRSLEVGLAAGLVVGIRPANLVAILPLVALGVVGWPTARARAATLSRHWPRIVLGAAAAAPLVVATLLAWSFARGAPVLFSYRGDEGFSFLHPQWRVLYSFRPHGLAPYAPVLVLAALGMVPLWRHTRVWFWPVTVALSFQTYLLASWSAWPLGAGFGHRGYVDAYGLLAVPLTALFAAAWSSRWRLVTGGVAVLACSTSMLGILAYWQGRLSPEGASPGSYLTALLGGDSSDQSGPAGRPGPDQTSARSGGATTAQGGGAAGRRVTSARLGRMDRAELAPHKDPYRYASS